MKLIIKDFAVKLDANIVTAQAYLDQGGQAGLTSFGAVELTPEELTRLTASLAKSEAVTFEIQDDYEEVVVSA